MSHNWVRVWELLAEYRQNIKQDSKVEEETLQVLSL